MPGAMVSMFVHQACHQFLMCRCQSCLGLDFSDFSMQHFLNLSSSHVVFSWYSCFLPSFTTQWFLSVKTLKINPISTLSELMTELSFPVMWHDCVASDSVYCQVNVGHSLWCTDCKTKKKKKKKKNPELCLSVSLFSIIIVLIDDHDFLL